MRRKRRPKQVHHRPRFPNMTFSIWPNMPPWLDGPYVEHLPLPRECPECMDTLQIPKDDYLCQSCRTQR